MTQKKILYISQEIYPYLDETPISNISRYLPQAIQEKGKEIRTFMPKYGNINERRNQLHEVIRLSGMNLIIDDTDHSLIIKVASIQAASGCRFTLSITKITSKIGRPWSMQMAKSTTTTTSGASFSFAGNGNHQKTEVGA